jgi:uroporphyrinogen III methyltransferase/synthase
VYLVGAGPGDPGLLTLRGVECLQKADVVLYDGLVSPLLLCHTQAKCERTSRAAGPEGKRLEQAEINARLVAAAKAGKTVVRLKGGDPFLFGRGSEEAAALAAEGIPFEVIPGVTAAIAAAAYAGLSLTHREAASSVAFVTGHEDPSKADQTLDYAALARFPGTLVFYMGLHRLDAIAAALIESGKSGESPACVISRATTAHQKTVEGTLAELPAKVRSHQLHAPSLIVIGECVRQRDQISWFEKKPLLGRRVGVTRPEHQSEGAIRELVHLGAEPVIMPLLEIAPPRDWSPVDQALDSLDAFDWLVFTSANGVDGFLGRLWERGRDLRSLTGLRVAAIGPATADRLASYHLRADVVPDEYRAEGLVEALREEVRAQRVLWAGADRGRDVLQKGLESAGATVEKIVVYQSRDIEALSPDVVAHLSRGEVDWIPLSSPSMVRRLAQLLPEAAKPHIGATIRLAAISPVTAEAARELALPIAVEATDYTWKGLLAAIVKAD